MLIQAGMTSVALTVFLIWLEGGFESKVTAGTQPAAARPSLASPRPPSNAAMPKRLSAGLPPLRRSP
jgi:hypothetical protein